MDLQKTEVDPSQVKIDKGGSGAVDSDSRSKTACSSAGGSSLKHCIIQALFVLFVIGNVTALYVLHFVNRPSPTTRFTFETFAATNGTSPDEGNAVSLSSSSTLRNGAGTTAYLSTMQLSDGDFYEYINFAPLGTTKTAYATNLMSYTRTIGTTIEGVLTTFTVGTTESTKTVTASTVLSGNIITGEYIRGLATLSDTLAVVLSMEPFASVGFPTRVTPVEISGTTATMVMAKREKGMEYSPTNFIAALPGMSAFVIAYCEKYNANGWGQRVKVGVVDPATKAITFSADTPKFAIDNSASVMTEFGKPLAVGKEGMFVIPYFQSTSSTTLTSPLSGLCIASSTYSSSAKTIAAFSTDVCQTKYMPNYLVGSIMLTDLVMAIAFYDGANNNALTVATVSVSSYDMSLSFRTSYVFSEVGGSFEFGTGSFGFSPMPSFAKLSGNRIAVSFLNPSQNGKPSVKVLHFSAETLAFKDVTPLMPVAKSDFNLIKVAGTNAVDNAVTQEVIAVSSDGVVTAYIGKRGTAVHQRFSVVEDFGAPVGILRKYNGKAKASVAISGKVEVSSKLTIGEVYYATTTGAVERANTTTGDVTGEYVYSADGSRLMTTNSKIGIAVDDDKLFVNTAMN